jgi:diguanylate cyclase (GGDEF)-like protein/PAS domain S-box-containing protein
MIRALRLFFIYLLSLVLFMSQSAYGLKKVKIELKWFHQFQFAGIYAAKEQGFYQKSGLDVEILERNLKSSPIKDVLSGVVQFGISDSTIILNRLQGKKVVLLAAIFQHSPLVLLTLSKNKIFSPLELKHKKIMYQKNVDDAVITAMLSSQGLHEEDFVHVPHTFKDDALLDESIDAMSAYLGDQTYFYDKNKIDVTVINPINYGVDLYGDMLFTSEKFYKENMDTVIKFRAATIKGWQYALSHPDEIINLILNKYTSNKTREQLLHEAENTELMIRPDLIEVGHLNKERLKRVESIYKNWNPKVKNRNTKGLLYSDYLIEKDEVLFYQVIYVVILVVLVAIISIGFALSSKRRKYVIQKQLNITSKKFFEFQEVIMHEFPTTMTDEQGVMIYVSDAMLDCLGYARDEMIGKNKAEFYVSEDVAALRKLIRASISRKGLWKGELTLRTKSKKERHFDTLVDEYFDPSGKKVGYISIHVDRTQKKEAEKLATTDALTGLVNRYQLDQQLNFQIQQAKRYKFELSAIFIDIDHFKSINDQLGHIKGDEALKKVALVMQSHSRDADIIGRWGGEEFLIICPHTDLQDAVHLANKLRIKISETVTVDKLQIKVSAGVSSFRSTDNLISFIERIDTALYEAKNHGRNQVRSV